mmetsp:Transcript_10326/g.29487  ORF Transcript_10326/g.29487 Transcript_10326/m.29487 type:complete len:136 (+) Transcript_10326:39-446(+)
MVLALAPHPHVLILIESSSEKHTTPWLECSLLCVPCVPAHYPPGAPHTRFVRGGVWWEKGTQNFEQSLCGVIVAPLLCVLPSSQIERKRCGGGQVAGDWDPDEQVRSSRYRSVLLRVLVLSSSRMAWAPASPLCG